MTESDTDGHDRHGFFVPLIQREIRLLVVLSLAAAALFAGTRALARWSRQISAREAADWFARGQSAVAIDDVDTAVRDFRRAVMGRRSEPRYAMALARALVRQGGASEARRLLQQLRDARPDDVEINYRLARLEAAGGNLADAVRYYNHAMYGLAGRDAPVDRFQLRAELIGVLLDRGERDAAAAELAALAREVPDRAPEHLQTAALAERAGNSGLALAEYEQAARLDPSSAPAAAGAGRAALARHDFARAEEHFDAAIKLGAADHSTVEQRAVARLAQASDPLAPRLALRERARRAAAGAEWALSRLDACASSTTPATTDQEALRTELAARQHQPATAFVDTDKIEATVALIGRALPITARCPDVDSTTNQAWTSIVQAHVGADR